MLKSSKLAKYIKDNALYNENGTYEIRNLLFEVDVPYIISYLDEGVGLDWYKEVYEPVSNQQLQGVIDKLKKDKLSRQAQITMSDHVEVYNPTYICTTSMTYYIENNRLNVTVNMRSNDAKRFPNDVAWQKKIQKYIASKLGVGVGKIYWFAVSFHVYKNDWKYFELLPYDTHGIFSFNLEFTLKCKDKNLIKNEASKIHVKLINEENDELTFAYSISNIRLPIRMEAYGEGDDLHLEEDYEYGIDDILSKSTLKIWLDNIEKYHDCSIVDISAKEINHEIRKI